MPRILSSVLLGTCLTIGGAHAESSEDLGEIVLDFESRESIAMEWQGGATGQSGISSEMANSGKKSLKTDYRFATRHGNAILEEAYLIGPNRDRQNAWALEFSHCLAADESLHLELLLWESSQEEWRVDIPLAASSVDNSEWRTVTVPLAWFRLITWERRDGILQAEDIDRISLRIYSKAKGSHGTLWLDSFAFVDALHSVTGDQEDGFTLLDLGPVFDSDSFATRDSPRDGDFNTGDWEARTLPAEFLPDGETMRLSGIPFEAIPTADGINNTIRPNRQVLQGFPIQKYSAAYFLASGKFGDQSGDVQLIYEDGTEEDVALNVSDWSMEPRHGESVAIKLPYAYQLAEIDRARTPCLYIQSIRIDDSRKLARIALPQNDYLKIFGITLTDSDSPPSVGVLENRSRVEIDPRNKMEDRVSAIDFSTTTTSVGVFGGSVVSRSGSHTLDIPTVNGYLTFVSEARSLPRSLLTWFGFQNRSAPFILGGIQSDLSLVEPAEIELVDSTSQKVSAKVRDGDRDAAFTMYLSRAWPAALYDVDLQDVYWYDAPEGGALYATTVCDGEVTSFPIKAGEECKLPEEPWILLWHRIDDGTDTSPGVSSTRDFAAPMLLVFEQKPARVHAELAPLHGGTKVRMEFSKSAGRIAAMPLFGIRRIDAEETRRWSADGMPGNVVADCRDWVRRLQRFPLTLQQEFTIDEDAWTVEVEDSFTWLEMDSAWDIKPLVGSPIPPSLVIAAENGYPVDLPPDWKRTSVNSYYGPFGVVETDTSVYTLPLSPYARLMPSIGDVKGDSTVSKLKKQLGGFVSDLIPEDVESAEYISDISWDISRLRLLAPLYLITGHDEKREAYNRGAVRNALKDGNLKIEKEPVTGQYFLMDDRFWAKDAVYDKEWCVGFMLQGLWSQAYFGDDYEFIESNWNKVRGLYRYYQIFFDWSTGTTWTMTTGIGANSDGVRIAYEGMLAYARMAHEVGDEEAWRDALVRSARQGASMYASWYATRWAADNGYVISGSRHIPSAEAELRFAPEQAWCEYNTNNASHRGDYFQATHALFAYNLAHLMFLHDTGLAETFVGPWTFEYMPELHPDWCDGNARAPDGKFYGDGSTMCHLIARSLLFRPSIDESIDCLHQSIDDTRVTGEWYSPIPVAPMALASMITSQAPLVQVPVHFFRIEENVYTAGKNTHRIVLQGIRGGESELRIRYWDEPPVKVVVNGADVPFSTDAALMYATVPLTAAADEACSLEVYY